MSDQQKTLEGAEKVMHMLQEEFNKSIKRLKKLAPLEFQKWIDAQNQSQNMRKLLLETISVRDAATDETSDMLEEAVAIASKLYEDARSDETEAERNIADVQPAEWGKVCSLRDAYRKIQRASFPDKHSQEDA